ncbi:MAG TPA: aspartyl protease family protein [Gemmataceae bacterium]|nr:aspartyl protease family protein [Gemmataceae bacterium]
MSARFSYSVGIRFPSIPAVTVTLRAPDGSRAVPGVQAHIDTAADRTVVPLQLVQQLGLQPVRQTVAHGLGTTPHPVGVYILDVEIPGIAVISTRVVSLPNEHFVLLGREILNLLRITLDGPNQVVEFH